MAGPPFENLKSIHSAAQHRCRILGVGPITFFTLSFAQKRAEKKNARDYPLRKKIVNFTATTVYLLDGVLSSLGLPQKVSPCSNVRMARSGGQLQHHVGVVRTPQMILYCMAKFETTDEATWFTPCGRLLFSHVFLHRNRSALSASGIASVQQDEKLRHVRGRQ